jgi:hypothetical protein
MARIIINDLHFIDAEIFLSELTNQEVQAVFGGGYEYSDQFFNIALKLVQAVVVTSAINIISSLTISFLSEF